ncbi:hypothetical protein [Bordetella flabilis]|uniref:Uncharacterized protein n=1 Tax=Bordetella flabilis TaxID=463014 RepID=A0A193GGK3_9BORD|nr:hypothetical protein [Bordetella flabilis]ANN78950.1 hypothetical protein BAU07_19130 [Bordetella flabilis]
MAQQGEILVDGHRVFCRVTCEGEHRYTVAIATSRQGRHEEPEELAWRAAATQLFLTREEAERHAHYVLLGVCAVRQDGEPVLAVT